MTKLKQHKADIAVIGAGSGGLSVAAGAAMLGLNVVLYEAGEMGGDCLNTGCVPSKALLTAAKKVAHANSSSKFGVHVDNVTVKWPEVQAHVKKAIEIIEPIDSQERFEELGVTVIREFARFKDKKTLISETTETRAARIVIAAGSKAFIPPIEGIEDVPYLTNETIFDVAELPEHLMIIGGGPIGIELGQAFRRLGSEVTIIEMAKALARAEPEHAEVVVQALKSEGATILEGAAAKAVTKDGETLKLTIDQNGETREISGSHLLVAVGRKVNTEGLDLEAGGVEHDHIGIKVKDNLRSVSNPKVWAVGDIAGRGQFTHLAGWHASVFTRNALFKTRSRVDDLPLPAVTYSEPELAQIGKTEAEARADYGDKIRVEEFGFEENDRAIAEGDVTGGIKLITDKSGKILGASILGTGAGDIIQMLALGMSNKLKLRDFTNFISPYPTRAEITKRVASKWYQPLVFGASAKRLISITKRIP